MRTQHAGARVFAQAHPEDAAQLVEQFPVSEAVGFLKQIPAVSAAALIQRMSTAAAADCLASLELNHGTAIVTALPAAVATALLRRVGPEPRNALLSELADDTKNSIQRLLTYPPDTVGSITDPGVLALPQDLSVSDARRQLRRHHGTAHHHVYVIDRDQRLVGLVHIRDLVGSRSKDPLASIMQSARVRLPATSRLAQAAAHPAWREVDALPVTDEDGVLLGMVRSRQLRYLDSAPTGTGIAGALLGLGELYWLGLATFLPAGRSVPNDRDQDSPSPPGEDHHG